MATVTALVRPFVDYQNFMSPNLLTGFDLDSAVGVQLDAVGLWIGRTRNVQIPISGAYFSWDTPGLGWDQGNWQGLFDSTTGITALDDNTYRDLLRAKIILNRTDGTTATMQSAILALFNRFVGTIVSIHDNQDMTMTVSISGVVPPAVYLSLLDNSELVVAPSGVGVTYTVTSLNTVALFGWDTESATVRGWDEGAWGGTLGVGPSQVTKFALVSSTSTSATFSWVPPPVGTGTPSYQLEYRVSGTNAAFQLIGSPTNSTQETVNNLTPGQSYDFQVYAINDTGAGPPSPYLTVTLPSSGASQVTGLAASAQTSSSITVLWNAVGGTTPTYSVQYRWTGTNGAWTTLPATTQTSATIGNLQSGTLYDIQVFATTTAAGPPSAVLTIGTTGALPGAISGLAVTSANVNDVVLTWSPPSAGSTAGLTYVVQYAQNATSPSYITFSGTPTTNSDGTLTVDVTGLQASTAYLFTVYAVNAGGHGPTSSAVSATTQAAPLGQITGLAVVSTTATTVTLSWNALGGAASYQVIYQQAGWTWWQNGPSVNAPTTTATVTLPTGSQGVTYYFEVYAT